MRQLKIWFDIVNTPHALFLFPIIKKLCQKHDTIITTRSFAETVDFVRRYGLHFYIVGKYYRKSRLMKILGVLYRDFHLISKISHFEVAISHGSGNSAFVAKFKGKPSITFDDNDISISSNMLYTLFTNYLITPSVIPIEALVKQGIKEEKIIQYHGFKEDIYIADFNPSTVFLKNLPFTDFIALRPENLEASYVPKNAKSLVPSLIDALSKESINILYLPRFLGDEKLVRNINVYTPSTSLNGLDICWYSHAVLTGAGTFAREAACMGTPAVSFFPGKQLLAVDKKMIENGWMLHSRDPEEIVEYVLNSKKRKVDMSRSKKVQREVFDIVERILEEIESKKRKR